MGLLRSVDQFDQLFFDEIMRHPSSEESTVADWKTLRPSSHFKLDRFERDKKNER